jgi:hypothetical protein
MTALAKERDTKRRSGEILSLAIAAAVICYAGAIGARDANGRATPGATATTLRGVGRVAETVDNSAGADDADTVTIEKGIFAFGNSATTDEITAADIGNDCYIVDDQTVAKTNGTSTRSVAGKVFDVDSAGVWVDFR